MTAREADLRELGHAQRLMVWAIAAWLPGFFAPAMFLTIPFQLYCVYRLSKALRLNTATILLCMTLVLVPLICLLVLLWINEKARRTLLAGGIRVGIWGAHLDDLPP